MLLVERILSRVEANPGAPACVSGDVMLTYRGLLALWSVATRYFHEQGIGVGEPVALTMSQTPLHVVVFLALARLGALVVPVSPFLRPGDRARLFAGYRIRRWISDRDDAQMPGVVPILVRKVHADGTESRLDYGGFVPGAESPLRIALTSGTTGAPRGTMQTHARFVERIDRTEADAVEEPRFIPPNLHVTSALSQAMHVLCKGGLLVFPRGYDNRPFFEAIREHRVTHVAIAGANLALMLEELPEAGPAFDSIRSLRFVGGSPTVALLDRARARFSPHVYVSYGVSEIGRVAIASPEVLAREPRSVGPALPGVRFEVVDAAGNAVARGVPGQARVSFDGMPASYYGPDAADTTRFRDGWFYPGDIARLSEDGLVFVEGRVDDVINLGGRKVSPRFVESILEEFPGVREAAAYVAGEGIGGPRLAAAIIPSGPLDWRALAHHAARALDIRAPAHYFELDSLPRNAAGKLQRDGLPAWVATRGKSRT
jgi:acyl-coenzyme A synthetase/AMP-(fatty) acid ligase